MTNQQKYDFKIGDYVEYNSGDNGFGKITEFKVWDAELAYRVWDGSYGIVLQDEILRKLSDDEALIYRLEQ